MKFTSVDSGGKEVRHQQFERPFFGTRPTWNEMNDMIARLSSCGSWEEKKIIWEKYIPACDAILSTLPFAVLEGDKEDDFRARCVMTLMNTWIHSEEPTTYTVLAAIRNRTDASIVHWFTNHVQCDDLDKIEDAITDFSKAGLSLCNKIIKMRLVDRGIEPTYRCKYLSEENTTRSNLGHKANLQGTDDDEEEKESKSQSKYREEGGDELPEDD